MENSDIFEILETKRVDLLSQIAKLQADVAASTRMLEIFDLKRISERNETPTKVRKTA